MTFSTLNPHAETGKRRQKNAAEIRRDEDKKIRAGLPSGCFGNNSFQFCRYLWTSQAVSFMKFMVPSELTGAPSRISISSFFMEIDSEPFSRSRETTSFFVRFPTSSGETGDSFFSETGHFFILKNSIRLIFSECGL